MGSTNEKRWQDVDAMLDAGIDVITTVNIQHLESVNDVVEKITGIHQQETIPDAIVRRAEQIEIVDVTPEALRRRMAHGNIYAADKIDASLSNYFRVGNLSALRELALLWLADRVEDSLQRYLDDHVDRSDMGDPRTTHRRDHRDRHRRGPFAPGGAYRVDGPGPNSSRCTSSSPTRSVTSPPTRPKRASSSRSSRASFKRSSTTTPRRRSSRLLAVSEEPRSSWVRVDLGPSGVRRTASSRRCCVTRATSTSTSSRSGGERPPHVHRRRQTERVTWTRSVVATVVTLMLMPLLTIVMSQIRSSLSLSTVFLVYLVAILALTTWAGAFVGVVGAVLASGLENYYFVKPLHTLEVARPDDIVALDRVPDLRRVGERDRQSIRGEVTRGGPRARGGADPRRRGGERRRVARRPAAIARIACAPSSPPPASRSWPNATAFGRATS